MALAPSDKSELKVIIGAGPAGLSCGVRLADHGHRVLVLEASNEVGGLARSFQLWGQTVDVGPHRFFSKEAPINRFWKGFVGEDYSMVRRLTRIYYKNKFFYYPLQPMNALLNLGLVDVAGCLASYALPRLNPIRNPSTFEEWVTNRFGRRLFKIFFKTYTEKVWGIPCSRIDADWAAQRIKKLSLYEAVWSAFFGDRSRKHKTLVDQFAYPHQGTGMVYRRMTERITASRGTVRLKAPVKRVLTEGLQVKGVLLESGEKIKSRHVVSSMPLTEMVSGIESVPGNVLEACQKLYYRNTVMVYLEIATKDLFPDNWIYVHSPEVVHGRITNFRNWTPHILNGRDTTILAVEYWCFDQDPVWSRSSGEMGDLAEEELRKIHLLKRGIPVLNRRVLRIARSYPVYEIGYRKPLGVIQNFVDSISGLRAIGRYGAFKYNNQDHSILMGILTADELVTGRRHSLWNINTDDEYQEMAMITDVEL